MLFAQIFLVARAALKNGSQRDTKERGGGSETHHSSRSKVIQELRTGPNAGHKQLVTSNNTRDFGLGRGLHNLRAIGLAANRCVLEVQTRSQD
ncbi:MAG: hypothetical protein WA970_10095, partial [Gammaproteobacteria bacterium]